MVRRQQHSSLEGNNEQQDKLQEVPNTVRHRARGASNLMRSERSNGSNCPVFTEAMLDVAAADASENALAAIRKRAACAQVLVEAMLNYVS